MATRFVITDHGLDRFIADRGYDPAGEAGEIYRAAYFALVDAKWARKREEYWRLHQR